MGTKRRGKALTAYDGQLGAGSGSSAAGKTVYSFNGTRQNGMSAALVICVGGMSGGSRTISGVTVAMDGGSASAATQLVASASAPYTQGIYIFDMSACAASYTIEVTFSGSMLGCAMVWVEFAAFPQGGTTTATENITPGDPIVSSSRTQTTNEVMFAIAGNQATAVTDIDWTYNSATLEGTDVTYGPYMLSVLYATPAGNGYVDVTSTVSGDFNATVSGPRLSVAYIQ